jgi:spoIIIJ-associated protein
MRSIECDGDSIDEAIENALRALELSRDRVEIEILSDAARGLFGFGGKKARVRATVRTPLAASRLGELDEAAKPEEPMIEVARETRLPPRGRREEGSKSLDPPISPRTTRSTPTMIPGDHVSTRQTSRATGAASSGTRDMTELGARGREVLDELLVRLGVTCTVDVRVGDGDAAVVLAVKGDSSGLLIGRRGQTLDALEYLVNRIVARGEEPGQGRIVLDVEAYRERRREYLEALAQRLAEKARQTSRVVTLNPMSPRDRRIVHLALRDDPGVETRSQGQGHFRKILIVPAARARRGASPASRPGS